MKTHLPRCNIRHFTVNHSTIDPFGPGWASLPLSPRRPGQLDPTSISEVARLEDQARSAREIHTAWSAPLNGISPANRGQLPEVAA